MPAGVYPRQCSEGRRETGPLRRDVKVAHHGVEDIKDTRTGRNPPAPVPQSITEPCLSPLLKSCPLSRTSATTTSLEQIAIISDPACLHSGSARLMCLLNTASKKLSPARGIFSKHRLHQGTHLPLTLPLGQVISSARNVLPSLICSRRKMLRIATLRYILTKLSWTSSS